MQIDQQLVDAVDANPIGAVVDLCDKVMEDIANESIDGWTSQQYETLIEMYAIITGVMEAHKLPTFFLAEDLTGSVSEDCSKIWGYLNHVQGKYRAESSRAKIEQYKAKFKSALNATFAYEFSQGDLEKIQLLVSELRDQISTCVELEDDHKRRLLKRLEKLQSELHKRISDLDRFWGLVGDAGVVLGKLGRDAKPIVDRITEIANIVWRTQSRSEELPTDTPRPLLLDESSPPLT
jgi:hypothetical protein